MKLPLFPLNTVLFPGCMLDLQIFEARYLDMISRCMKQDAGFGVVCIVEGEEVGEAASRLRRSAARPWCVTFNSVPMECWGFASRVGGVFASSVPRFCLIS
jgi:hypothetical protein